MPKPTYLVDGRLIPQIKQILRAQKGRTSVSYLTEELKMQYREYARKKKNALVKSVAKGLTIAMKELQKEGINISTNGGSSSDSEADYEADQPKDKNIMNSMINSMYRQGRPATPTSVNKVTTSTHTTSVSSSADSQKRASELPGAQAGSDNLQGTESLSWCIDRKSNTNTPEEKMKLDVSHNSSIHLAPANNDMDLIDGDGFSDKTKENLDSAKSGQLRKRRRESPDGLKKKKQTQPLYPNVNFSNVGGNERILQHLLDRCLYLENPGFLQKMKGGLPQIFLLQGPTGCGKTLLANAIAGEYEVPLLSVTATELVGGISGDSEANIRDLFNQAAELAPCILFIDVVDELVTKREMGTKGMESRVITQLSKCMEDLTSNNLPVLMICATNKQNSLDEAFRRHFDIEYALRYPSRDARKSILQALCQEVQLAEDVSLYVIADLTPGYVGSDLKKLVTTTNAFALVRTVSEYKMHRQNGVIDCEKTDKGIRRKKFILTAEEMNRFSVSLTMSDFQKAMTEVKPTAKQEDVILIPDTTWDDIGGLDSIREELNLCIMERTRRPELYQVSGMTKAEGVLLVGPPGCGKTSIGKAVANEAGLNFLYVKGPELLTKYVGESEKNVRDIFKKARNLAPCVIFFDEIDSICPMRSSKSEEGSGNRVANMLLLEMDGLEPRNEVHIIAATNRLGCLDDALLRPGRIDTKIYVGLPSPEARVEILKALTKNGTSPKLADDVDLDRIGKDRRCDGFSGADLGNLVRVATKAWLRHIIESTERGQPCEVPVLTNAHFENAFERVHASVNAKGKKNYEAVNGRRLKKRTAKRNMAVQGIMQILSEAVNRRRLKKRTANKRHGWEVTGLEC